MDHRSCFSGDDELNEFLDGAAKESRESEIRRHLGDCSRCSIRFEVARGLKELLSLSKSEVISPSWLKTSILNSLGDASKTAPGGFWEYLTGLFRFRPALPVAIVSALVIVLLGSLFYETGQPGTMPLVTAMVHEHYEYLDGPGENGFMSNDPDEITGWMAANAGIALSISSDRGLPAPNSACVLKEHGETVGYVGFDYQNQKVSLFMIKECVDGLFGPRKMKLNEIEAYCGKCTGMNYVLWKTAEFVCVLVGDLPEESLIDLAGKMI